MPHNFSELREEIRNQALIQRRGYVSEVGSGSFKCIGLNPKARVGDLISILTKNNSAGTAEIVGVTGREVIAMPVELTGSLAVGDTASIIQNIQLRPDFSWLGRVLDAFAHPIDGKPLAQGLTPVSLEALPPETHERRPLGKRLSTKFALLDTILPIAQGQRIGIFAGSGVGKTTLLADLASEVDADIIVIGLIGERGREVQDFIKNGLGERGLARSVVVAATSNQSPILKRRAAFTATSIAEYFRDRGKGVLLIVDSLTRFAEAHREIALTAGETPSLRAFPPSTVGQISALAERAGPGGEQSGDITAIYSVLVAGSDMDEPVADMARGVLDGHIVLEREIAERGRFPAIDILRSVSRSLPEIASQEENSLISKSRELLTTYEQSKTIINSGLYQTGSNEDIDRAIGVWAALDEFASNKDSQSTYHSFLTLKEILKLAK